MKLHDSDETICFLTMFAMKSRKSLANLWRRKMLHQKHESQTAVIPEKHWVDWISTRWEKNVTTSKMNILRERTQKLKNKGIFHFMTTFYNCSLKIETNWVNRVVESILETRNASDVSMHVCFIHSWIKHFKKMQRKKD